MTSHRVASEPTATSAPSLRGEFGGGFSPRNAPFGGFGGGDCKPTKTPVVFLHGNGHKAEDWSLPGSGTDSKIPSVRATLLARGYKPCELFGVTYLSPIEKSSPALNFHRPEKARFVADFLGDVLSYTNASTLDVVGHSLGVTTALHAIDYGSLWPKIRRFVAISGAMRGIGSCFGAGFANPLVTTCGSQNTFNSDVFGFWPDGAAAVPNPRMGIGSGGFSARPKQIAGTRFYSIRAGRQDQIICAAGYDHGNCWRSSTFQDEANVRAQVDIGVVPGDSGSGVGHFRSMTNAGEIILNMLDSGCVDEKCCENYPGPCRL